MTLCDESITANSLKEYSDAVDSIIETDACEEEKKTVVCGGYRCDLGKCLDQKQICDGKRDCHDGYDESDRMCIMHGQNCSKSEFKCRNGKCVAKNKFCDHFNDCGDLTDEPTVCSCFTYLQ